MATMKPIVKNYMLVEQTPNQIDESYPTLLPFVLGIIHIFCGLFSIALGIGAICIHASGYFIGYGIWCGFIVSIACIRSDSCARD
jgi:hypothetical protein